MKKLLFILLALAVSIPGIAKKKTFQLPPQNLINQGLEVYLEFVRLCDDKLGIAAGEKLNRARIDKKHPIAFYYVREDSLLVSNNLDNIFLDMKRVMYPVFLDGKIRGSVTFGLRENGWQAVEFADSVEVVRILRIKEQLRLGKGKQDITVVAYMPTSKQTIYLEGNDLASANITSPNILDVADAMDFYAGDLQFLNTPRLPIAEFIKGYRDYINDIEDGP